MIKANCYSMRFLALCFVVILCSYLTLAKLTIPSVLNYKTLTLPFAGDIEFPFDVPTITFRLTITGTTARTQAEVDTIRVLVYHDDDDETLYTEEVLLVGQGHNYLINSTPNRFDLSKIPYTKSDSSTKIRFKGIVTFVSNTIAASTQFTVQATIFSVTGSVSSEQSQVEYIHASLPFESNESSLTLISPEGLFTDNTLYRTTLHVDINGNKISKIDNISISLSPDYKIEIHPDITVSTCSISLYDNITTPDQPSYIYPAELYRDENDNNKLIINPYLNQHVFKPIISSSNTNNNDTAPEFETTDWLHIECHDVIIMYDSRVHDKLEINTHAYIDIVDYDTKEVVHGHIPKATIIGDAPVMVAGTPFITMSDIAPAEAQYIPNTLSPHDSTHDIRYINTQHTINIHEDYVTIEELSQYTLDIALNGIKYDTIDIQNSLFYTQISCNDIYYPIGQGTAVFPSSNILTLNAHDGYTLDMYSDKITLHGSIITIPFIDSAVYNITNDNLHQCIIEQNLRQFGQFHITVTGAIKLLSDTTPSNTNNNNLGEIQGNGSSFGIAGITVCLHSSSEKNMKQTDGYYIFTSSSASSSLDLKSPAGDNLKIAFTSPQTQKETKNGISFDIFNPGMNVKSSSSLSWPSSGSKTSELQYPPLPLQLNHKDATITVYHSHISLSPSDCEVIKNKVLPYNTNYMSSEYQIQCNKALFSSSQSKILPKPLSNQMLVATTIPHEYYRPIDTLSMMVNQSSSSSVSPAPAPHHHLASLLSSIRQSTSLLADNDDNTIESNRPAVVFALFDLPEPSDIPDDDDGSDDDDTNDNQEENSNSSVPLNMFGASIYIILLLSIMLLF